MYSSNAQPTGTNRPRACPNTVQNQSPHRLTRSRTPDKTPRYQAQHSSTRARVHMQFPTNTPHGATVARTHNSIRNTSKLGTPPPHPNKVVSGCVCSARVTAAIAKGKHPVPYRTRKLSLSAPMVLQPRGCGRVGRRRTYIVKEGSPFGGPSFAFACIWLMWRPTSHRVRGSRGAHSERSVAVGPQLCSVPGRVVGVFGQPPARR